MTKQELRKKMLKKRSEMTSDEVVSKSRAIFKNLLSIKEFCDADSILCYASYNNEVITDEIKEFCFLKGKRIAYPKVDGNYMDFYYIENSNDLKPGFKGILEPSVKNPVLEDDIKNSVLILPGTSFDTNFNRNGYGGGYYDRYITIHRPSCVIGIAYEFQISNSVPHDEYDIKPDYIVSEVKKYGK